MITNLIATLTIFLTTNVTETVTQYEFWEPVSGWNYTIPTVTPAVDGSISAINTLGNAYFHWPNEQRVGRNPLAKTITTTITKTHRLTYEWPAGRMNTNDVVDTLSSINKYFRMERKEEWKAQ